MPLDIGTPVVAPTSSTYATVDDVLQRYDIDQVKRLVTDNRVDISVADLRVHPNFTTTLQSAAGMVETALLHGGRYKVSDLESLTGNAAAYLADLVSEVCFEHLLRRRSKSQEERDASLERVRKRLDLLASGKDVFGLTAHVDAGLMEHKTFDLKVTNQTLRASQLRGRLFADD